MSSDTDRSPRAGWDTVITPEKPWFGVDLKEIWAYRDLLLLLVRRDLVAVYKQTLLGPAWQVLQPLLTSVTFALVFGVIAKLSTPGIPGLLFYMAAVVPWNLFATVITRTGGTLITNSALMTKVYFPRLVAPMATSISAGFSSLVQLASFFLFALGYRLTGAYPWTPGPDLVWLPVLLIDLLLLAFALGTLVSALTTRFRDFTYLVTFGVQLLMYASPVVFPLSGLREGSKARMFLEANPMTPLIEGFRGALLGTHMDWSTLWYPILFTVVALFAGLASFQRVERTFADVV